jgi:Abnormal spindle-like microcephaly-assoc'd, ASPM-SPD-2-Hydin
MSLHKEYQVLVLQMCSIVATAWMSGCAGVAEPLPSLAVTPASLSVSAKVGTSTQQVATITNVGTTSVSVNQAILTGAGFSMSGLSTPVVLAPKESQSFTVKFTAATAGTVNGSLAMMTDLKHRPVILSLHGTAATGNPSVTSVAVSPTVASPAPTAKVQFTATVQGSTANNAVTWTATMGTINPAGVYTAPATAASGMVTATSVADPTKSASAVVTVAAASTPSAPPPGGGAAVTLVTITPARASVATGGTQSFNATVLGSASDKAVTWRAALGTITAAGVYTAPRKTGTDVVTATSVADSTKSAAATITVTATPTPTNPGPSVTSVTVLPSPASSITGGTLTFSASVQGSTSNKAVTWKAALGTINAAGGYTAPAKAGTDSVTATSVADPTKSGSATVTVTAAPPNNPPSTPSVTGVTISPTSASATTGGTLQFSASVSGSASDKSVSWSAAVGQITAGGLYTAPGNAGSDTVTATSNTDSTKSASAHVTVSAPVAHSGALPAFPEAQGGGAGTTGGRGGVVMEVSNLNDSGPGSLRACVQATGARHCVFRVAGLIPVTSGDLTVNNPFLSIDGQTAPGQIILGGPNTNGEVLRISTHDVVVRYITVSPDNYNTPSGPSTGTVGLSTTNCDCFNIMIDHVSTRWAGNKMLIGVSNYVAANHNVSFQWSMLYEPHAMHPVGPGMSGNPVGCPSAPPDPSVANPCFETEEVQYDYHHSLFANIDHRIPENANKSSAWDSNIVYNWSFYANEWLGASTIDVANNVFKPGNLNAGAQTYPVHFSGNLSSELPNGTPSDYVSGNICQGDSSVAGDQWGRCTQQISGENGSETGSVPDSWKRNTPDARDFPISPDPASSLDSLLLPSVGNSQHLDCTGNWVSHRDAPDSRVINQYKTGGSGGFWPNGVTQAGPSSIPQPNSNYQDNPVTGFTACTESMHDGIPDQWKTLKGLSTSDPNLHNAVAPNGYTWLENYLNGQ